MDKHRRGSRPGLSGLTGRPQWLIYSSCSPWCSHAEHQRELAACMRYEWSSAMHLHRAPAKGCMRWLQVCLGTDMCAMPHIAGVGSPVPYARAIPRHLCGNVRTSAVQPHHRLQGPRVVGTSSTSGRTPSAVTRTSAVDVPRVAEGSHSGRRSHSLDQIRRSPQELERDPGTGRLRRKYPAQHWS